VTASLLVFAVGLEVIILLLLCVLFYILFAFSRVLSHKCPKVDS